MGLLHITFQSKALQMQTQLNVLIPDDIKKQEPIEVLYLLHGYMGNYSDIIRLTNLERYLFDRRMVVVMPSGYNGYYTNLSKPDQNYETLIGLEIPNYIKRTFGFRITKKYIAGYSMGGYGAIKIGLKYKFDKIGAFSSALDIDRFKKDIKERTQFFESVFKSDITNTKHDVYALIKRKKTLPPFLIGCGTEDYFYSDYLKLKDLLDEKSANYDTFVDKYGHDWTYWDLAVKALIRWL